MPLERLNLLRTTFSSLPVIAGGLVHVLHRAATAAWPTRRLCEPVRNAPGLRSLDNLNLQRRAAPPIWRWWA